MSGNVNTSPRGCIRTVTYKIGQTITVQGAVDSGSMQLGHASKPSTCRHNNFTHFCNGKEQLRYIIKGGSAEVFVNHRYVKDVPQQFWVYLPPDSVA